LLHSSQLVERATMTTKRLGNSDLFLTPIGFGAWAIGGSGWEFAWGAQDGSDSIAAIHEAMDAGINGIDTAAGCPPATLSNADGIRLVEINV
jgi:aryl-alcohol dehydrogenase-like predicted oxidoreductase